MNRNKIFKIGSLAIIAIVATSLVIAGWKTGWRYSFASRAAQPEYWPTSGWRTSTPEEQGIDSGRLAEGLLAIRQKEIMVHSLLIIRHGYSVVDATFYPYDGQTPHDIASDTKSVMTTLIGIAADQGKLSLDDKMVSFFQNYTMANLDEQKNSITVAHLASMSSGLDCTAAEDEKTLREMQASADYVQFALDRSMINTPGEQFIYCSPAIHLLSPILQQAAGQTPLDFARQYLFEPLGIQDAMWEQDPQGNYNGWGDLSLLPADMAKIGFLFLHNGQWDGRQIVSSRWVEQATKAKVQTPDGNGYGYGWWIDPAVEGAYRADGRGGQYIVVLPEWDMVIVTTGGGFILDDIAQYLLASIVDLKNPLPANPTGVTSLEDALASVQRPPAATPVAALPEIAMQISGKTYVFQPNPASLESVAIQFDGSAEATIYVQPVGSPLSSHPVGLDGVFRFSPGFDGRPSGYRGSWVDLQTFLLEYDGICNNDHSFIKIRFEGTQVILSVQETAHVQGVQFSGQVQE